MCRARAAITRSSSSRPVGSSLSVSALLCRPKTGMRIAARAGKCAWVDMGSPMHMEPVGKALRIEMVLLPEKADGERCFLRGEDTVLVRGAIAFPPSIQLIMQNTLGR